MKTIAAALGRLRSLQLRFMLIVVLGALMFSALGGAMAYRFGHERALANSRATLDGLVQAVEKTVAVGAFAADPVLLREVVDGLARNEWVAAVEVLSAQGVMLARSGRPAAAVDDAGLWLERNLASPFDAAEQVGVLRIRGDQLHIDAAATQQALIQAALMAGQVVLVAGLLYAVAAHLVSRPIVRLARQLHAMSPGTDARLAATPLHQNDEIGLLIGGANALLDANAVALQRERSLRAEIEAMEAQYRQIFDSSSAGIFVLDAQGRLINGNPTVSRVVGLSLAQLRELQHPNFIERVFGRPEQVELMIEQAGRLGETVSGDLELVERDAARRWVHCLISVQTASAAAELPRRPTMVEGVIYDITERKSAETAARWTAEHDGLTGLVNRAGSQAVLDRMIADAMQAGAALSVLCIDLDGFKQVNDNHGHHAGDQVLMACAERMKAAVRRQSDLVARVGGDEFLVVLRELGPADPVLASTAAALVDALHQPVPLDRGGSTQVGASIGIACLRWHGNDRIGLVQAADRALYAVKFGGKNAYALAVPATVQAAVPPRVLQGAETVADPDGLVEPESA